MAKSGKSSANTPLPDDLVDDEGEDSEEADAFLPWLVNATILLQGKPARCSIQVFNCTDG